MIADDGGSLSTSYCDPLFTLTFSSRMSARTASSASLAGLIFPEPLTHLIGVELGCVLPCRVSLCGP